LAAARVLLQPLGGAGMSSPGVFAMLLHAGSQRREAEVRSQQIAAALRDSQRSIRLETLQAVELIETRLTQVGLTKQRLEVARAHLLDSERRQKLTATPLTLQQTRLETLVVDQDLLHDVLQWKIAVIKLKSAQGLLATECGYNAANRCQ
jgi:hypothetical protein